MAPRRLFFPTSDAARQKGQNGAASQFRRLLVVDDDTKDVENGPNSPSPLGGCILPGFSPENVRKKGRPNNGRGEKREQLDGRRRNVIAGQQFSGLPSARRRT